MQDGHTGCPLATGERGVALPILGTPCRATSARRIFQSRLESGPGASDSAKSPRGQPVLLPPGTSFPEVSPWLDMPRPPIPQQSPPRLPRRPPRVRFAGESRSLHISAWTDRVLLDIER